jgi:hypothetical protein
MAAPSSTQKIQWGVEATAGTAVNATAIYRGKPARIKDTQEIKRPAEHIGLLVPTSRTYIPKLGAELDLPESEATYQQLPYLGSMGIAGLTAGAGTKNGGGSGYIYDFPFPVSTTKNTINTYTVEAGDAQDNERMVHAFCSEFKLSGQRDQAVMMSGKLIGRQAAVNAATAGLTAPTTETILFNKSKLYIDTTGTIGNTQINSTFVSFSCNVKTGWKPLPVGDGTLYYSAIDFADPEVTLDVTFIYDSNATAEKVLWRAQTAARVRLLFEGNALTTGNTYTVSTLKLDVAGKWMSFEVPAEKDGFQVCTGKLTAMLDTTASLYFDMTVVADGLTALP